MTSFDDLLAKLDNVRPEGNSYLARCPAHPDDRPSLLLTLESTGRLLVYCRAGCKTHAVVEALGLKMADLFNMKPGTSTAVAKVGPKAPPTIEHIAAATIYVEAANTHYRGSPAATYAEERFGIDEDLGYYLGLGYDDGTIACTWTTPAYTRVPRLVVPFAGFDGTVRGWQSRALEEDEAPWCGPKNPPGHAWSTIGVFDLDNDERNLLVTEGPGDRLTAVAAGYSAVAVRGAALARNTDTLDQLVENLVGRRVVLCGDNDEAGVDFNVTLGAHLAAAGHQVHTLAIPTGSDLTDWREANPSRFADELRRGLRAATRIDANSLPAPPDLTDEDDSLDIEFQGDDLPRTDEGNAMRLMAVTGGSAQWCPELGYILYNDGRWSRDRHRQIDNAMAVACAFMVAAGHFMVAIGEDTDDDDLIARGERLVAWGRASQNSPRFGNAIKHAQPKVAIEFEVLDRHDHLLVCGNGTVDLRSGEILEHDPEHYMTHRIETAYNPEAEAPRWRQFLLEIFDGDADLIDYMQRLIGYGVTGSTREQIFAVLHGSGANGKSVFLNVLNTVLEDIVGVAAFSAFESKPTGASTADLASLRGKRLVFAQEGERNKAMAEAVIKRATGGDRVTCRHLYKDEMTYQPKFLLLLATNYKPRFGGQDPGLWRRVILVPFPRYFTPEERDIYLTETLLTEAEGILAWIVEGAIDWYRNGLDEPLVIKQSATDYKETSDDLAGFCDFIVVPHPHGRIKGSELYELYRDWCLREGVKPWSSRALNEAVVERMTGVVKVKRMDGVWLDGLRLATPEDREHDE